MPYGVVLLGVAQAVRVAGVLVLEHQGGVGPGEGVVASRRVVDRASDLRPKSINQSNKHVIYTSYDSIYIERSTNLFDGMSKWSVEA